MAMIQLYLPGAINRKSDIIDTNISCPTKNDKIFGFYLWWNMEILHMITLIFAHDKQFQKIGLVVLIFFVSYKQFSYIVMYIQVHINCCTSI